MGQDASSPKSSPRGRRSSSNRPERRSWSKRNSSTATVINENGGLTGQEVEAPQARTLKEQWQAKREANVALREAAAEERRRKKEALRAALAAQQKEAEKAEKQDKKPKKKSSGGNEGGSEEGGDDDAEALRLRQAAAEAEAALTAAQVSAQLAVFQTFMNNNPELDDELENVDGNPANMFDRDVATAAARKTLKHDGTGEDEGKTRGKSGKKTAMMDDDDSIGEVSLHSSDYQDEELMQGLNDLDEELEAEFQQQIETLQAQVEEHKQASLACLREHQDKAGALRELQKAKAIEAQIKRLMDEHGDPLSAQIEAQEKKIAELENLVATRKQESLTALRSGDKPTALEKLKESKGFQSQVDEAKAKLAALEEEKTRQLHSNGKD